MDWLDIFLYKKDLEDIEKFNSFYQKEKIKESFEGIDLYIDKILYKKDNIYFQCFALISYNLERFLILKEKRKTTKKKKLIQPRNKKRRDIIFINIKFIVFFNIFHSIKILFIFSLQKNEIN
jgi:hypothetical protein